MTARILVADDSTTMRKIVLRALGAAGVTAIVEAEDGDEALRLFKTGEFDLVLTDWRMPGRTGIEVAREIRRLDTNVPIILMATELEQYPVAEATAAGVTDRLIKPFTPETVRDLLGRYSDKPKSPAPRVRTKLAASVEGDRGA
ncbi:MAG: response regulator [Planctomycetes bacterium]|nr:response regulator [Planctomycetota bacterium]